MKAKKENIEQKRYSLVHGFPKSDNLTIINFSKDENGNYIWNADLIQSNKEEIKKYKATLAEIDMFTNSFVSGNHFLNLVLGNLFDEDPENVYVLYKHNGYNSLNVSFGNDALKRKASMVKNATIEDPKEITSMVNMLLDRDSKFLRFLIGNQDHYMIYDDTFLKLAKEIRIKKDFAEGSICDTYDIYNDTLTLKKKLTNYKIYREVFLAKQAYENYLKEQDKKPNTPIKEFEGFSSNEYGQIQMFKTEPPKQKIKKKK